MNTFFVLSNFWLKCYFYWFKGNNFQDVTFKLPDGSEVGAHKLVLGLASPFFEAQFFGLLATEQSPMVVKNVESSAFR